MSQNRTMLQARSLVNLALNVDRVDGERDAQEDEELKHEQSPRSGH
eukprot:CAMPEP_0115105732 /NCGR_PEP_ID=MMETSP0227-20121206/36188_1 /TAXON_ID=89957 /ORGANISM="Polarella glacialis, Strain CCMP 1383" /LENGTH=45 /DNA_ID= /DNA_START= /DNA_END= /DNA_ORIENTATION=